MKGKKIVPQIIAGAITGIGVWVAKDFYGIVVPPEQAVLISTILGVIISLLTPDSMEADE